MTLSYDDTFGVWKTNYSSEVNQSDWLITLSYDDKLEEEKNYALDVKRSISPFANLSLQYFDT